MSFNPLKMHLEVISLITLSALPAPIGMCYESETKAFSLSSPTRNYTTSGSKRVELA
jgi:hypothetical protein